MTTSDAIKIALDAAEEGLTGGECVGLFITSLTASGYAVVPRVSTLEMRWQGRQQAIENSHGTDFPSTDNIQSIWRAMVSAATGDDNG